MAKLGFIYKKEENRWTNLEDTELLMDIYNGNSTLYIGTKEDRKLKEMAEGVKRELRKRTLLKQDEELEISEFDKYVMEFEKDNNKRVNSEVYGFCKMGYKAVEEGKITLEYLIEILSESRCSECI